MNSKVKIQTNKAELDVCLRESLVLQLNLNVFLVGLPWPLFIGGQVSRIQSGSCDDLKFDNKFEVPVMYSTAIPESCLRYT
jgi:hypothetical protein